MSTPYLGEIRTVGFNFPPVDWMQCNGQLLSISENEALFALLGTTYGGDGVTTFGLPNLQSRVNVDAGTGVGLSSYVPGQAGGLENVTLLTNQMPTHQHAFALSVNATTNGTSVATAGGNYPATSLISVYSGSPTGTDTLAAGSLTGTAQPVGGSQPHSNIQPVLALNCIICVQGIFPPQQ